MKVDALPRKKQDSLSTQERLLDAAARILARDGLHGATTREIASDAGVNEVTLFRHFQSKENLLGAVFRRVAAQHSEALAEADTSSHDVHGDLLRCARSYDELIEKNQALIRTIIGEASRYPEHARRMIHEAFQPFRAKLVGYLEAGQAAGTVRRDLAVSPAIDVFTGMLLAGMLRRTSQCLTLEYSRKNYLETAVEIFVRGISRP
jgi:AcrR family transcriptional regulator